MTIHHSECARGLQLRRTKFVVLLVLTTSACDRDSGGSASGEGATGVVVATAGTATTMATGAEPVCYWDQSKAECEAKEECQFVAGGESALVDGECVGMDAEVGWCMELPVGSQHSPSWWYELETGRVFGFPDTPLPSPEGWAMCGCEELGAPACGCNPRCELGDSGGST